MLFDMREYSGMLKSRNINIIYSGPMWDDGMKELAEVVRTHLSHDELSGTAAKGVFSVFVEQVTNVLMYSAKKEKYAAPDKDAVEVSTGTLILGQKDNTYFIQTGNAIKKENMELIKGRIDHLNSLDKQELRQYHRERLHADNDNPESKGAGLGLIEIARRATAPIVYDFEPVNENLVYFTMYVEINQGKREE